MSCWYSTCSWEWGEEDARSWIDCIFIAMLCDGGGEGSSVSRPFSVLEAHTIFHENPKQCKNPLSHSSKSPIIRAYQRLCPWDAEQDGICFVPPEGAAHSSRALNWPSTWKNKVPLFWYSLKILPSLPKTASFHSSRILRGVNICPWGSKEWMKDRAFCERLRNCIWTNF